jgi:protein required for attachment to host cells
MATTWILAADSYRARLFELAPRGEVREIGDFVHPAARERERDLLTDAPGRYFVKGRHDQASANEPHTPAEQVEEEKFARQLADELERGRTSNRYDKLCLVAPPRFLGRIKDALGKEVGKRLSLTVPKDLAAFDAETILGYVRPGLGLRQPQG